MQDAYRLQLAKHLVVTNWKYGLHVLRHVRCVGSIDPTNKLELDIGQCNLPAADNMQKE
jgi:hypothetical protein